MPILNQRLREDIGRKSLLHAVLFPKSLHQLSSINPSYTPKQSREWLMYHNLVPIHNRDTINFRRFRIREQVKGMKFYTIKLNTGVELVYMF